MTQLSTGAWVLRVGTILLAAFLLLFLGTAPGQEKDKPEGEQWFKRLDTEQCADLEKKVQKVYGKVAPSVVRILNPKKQKDEPDSWFSGVIVSPSGEVFTCAHHDLPPQTKVTVELADGSRVKGTMLGLVKKPEKDGFYRAHDLGMMRLDEKRDWPAAALGRPSDLDNGEMCLAVGNPSVHKPGQPPLLRLGRVLPPRGYGTVRSSCRVLQGDSGGPLFDLQGRVLGVLRGTGSMKWAGSDYASVEVFVAFRDRLRDGEEIVAQRERLGRPVAPPKDAFGAFEANQDLAKTAAAAHRSTVEILGDGKPVSLGLIVEPDGWIVTKRTELSGCEQIVCSLADGRRLKTRVTGGSKEHDLALLKVDATDLPAAKWAKADGLRVGQIVASLGADPRPLHFGVVGGTRVSNPAVKGYLPINGKPTTPKGLTGHVFTEVWKNRPDIGNIGELLKADDLITHLDDTPTPTPEEYSKLRDKRLAAADALVGERIKLTIRRGEQTLHVFVPIIQSAQVSVYNWKQCPLSLRRNGFPAVFAHDGGIAPEQCSGPVVNRSGEVVGINIARADEVQTFAIPGDVVQKVVSELKAKAGKE